MKRKKYKNKYRSESTRLQNWNYSWNGAYHITVKTKMNIHFFGKIVDEQMYLNEIGKIAQQYWHEIPNHFKYVVLDEMIIMPDHVHLLIWIINPNNKIDDTDIINMDVIDMDVIDMDVIDRYKACLVSNINQKNNQNNNHNENRENDKSIIKYDTSKTIGQKRFQKQEKHSISSIIGSYKSVVTKNARLIDPNFGWQRLFYDQLIRDEKSLNRVRKYIINNPKKWNKK